MSTSPIALTQAGSFIFVDQSRLLHYSGLGLLLLSVAMALVSLWLSSSASTSPTRHWPGLARLIHSKPLMLATLFLGIALLMVNRTPQRHAEPSPQAMPQAPVAREEPPSAPVRISPTPASPTSAPPAPVPPPKDPAPDTLRPTPAAPAAAASAVRPPKPAKPAPSVTIEAPRMPIAPAIKPPPEVAPKAPGASLRCTRLLEKAGSGEPLSAAEQKEMGSTCH